MLVNTNGYIIPVLVTGGGQDDDGNPVEGADVCPEVD